MSRRTHAVTLIPGDWIGPEITEVVQRILQAAGVSIEWETFAWEPGEDPPPEVLESARRTGVILKNRVEAPRRPGRLPATVWLRKELDMWAQVRRVQTLPGVPSRFPDIDLVIVREISEDIYRGLEHSPAPGVYESIRLTTEQACERILRFGFRAAMHLFREHLVVVHKANILKLSDGLFLETARRVAEDYPTIEMGDVIVDALCMRMVRDPTSLDVLVCGNLFGDIVSDLACGLAGGISVGTSVSYGDDVALFENPHGRAPELVGTGRANPIPMLNQAVQMLVHLGEHRAADRIWHAVRQALAEGLRTVDVGGEAGCREVEEAVLARL